VVHESGLPAPADPQWQILTVIAGNPWFRRVWIVQEVSLAEFVNVQIGRHACSWVNFCNTFSWMVTKGDRIKEGYTTVNSLWWTWQYARRYPESPLPLLSLLRFHRGLDASHPLDHIYGLLGMSRECAGLSKDRSPALRPAYGSATADVYCDVVHHLIQQPEPELTTEPSLGILKLVHHDEASLHDATFPSWVPRWDRQPRRWLPLDESEWAAFDKKNAEASRGPNRTLRCKGVQVDTVEWVVQYPRTMPDYVSREKTLSTWFQTIKLRRRRCPGSNLNLRALARGFVITMADEREPIMKNAELTLEDIIDWFVRVTPLQDSDEAQNGGCFILDKPQSAALDELVSPVVPYFVTKDGAIGRGPPIIRSGDSLCFLFGSRLPVVLRNTAALEGECWDGLAEARWKIVGLAHVTDWVDGQLNEMWRRGELEEQWFDIH
jgi:hypothetical protein